MPTSDRGIGRIFGHGSAQDAVASPAPARIGPNALIQTGQAVSALYGVGAAQLIFEAAGLGRYLEAPPTAMVDEHEPVALFAAIRAMLPPAEADRVLAEAGYRTAHYILDHRIPPLARKTMPKLHPEIASRLLVPAISRHAWTFAGSGVFRGKVMDWARPRVRLEIVGNPLATPGCPWHAAVFRTLFSTLCGCTATTRHLECCAAGSSRCVTELLCTGA